MEKVDRELQRYLLETAGDAYPDPIDANDGTFSAIDPGSIRVNLSYLHEHQLIRLEDESGLDGTGQMFVTITAEGIDFLADDGGLSAVKKVVTVKFDPDTIRQLLIDQIEKTPGTKEEKSKVVEALKTMKGEALKDVTKRVIEAGVAAAPNLLRMVMTWMHQA